MATAELVVRGDTQAFIDDAHYWRFSDPGHPAAVPGPGDDAFSDDSNMSGSVSVHLFHGGVLVSGSITASIIEGTGVNGSGAHISGMSFTLGAGAVGGTIDAGDVIGQASASGGGRVTVSGVVQGSVAVGSGGTVTAGQVTNSPLALGTTTLFTNDGGTISIQDAFTSGGIGIDETLTAGTTTIGSLGIGDAAGTSIRIVVQNDATLTVGALSFGAQAGDFTAVQVDGAAATFNYQPTIIGNLGGGALALIDGASKSTGPLTLGAGSTGTGSVSVGLGSSLTTGALILGQAGFGSIGASGGTITVDGPITAGQSPGGRGAFNASLKSTIEVNGAVTLGLQGRGQGGIISGGSIARINGPLVLGSQPGSFGDLTVTGQGSDLFAFGKNVTIGDQGSGTLTVAGGARFDAEVEDVVLGKSSGSSGTLILVFDSLSSQDNAPSSLASVRNLTIGEAGTGTVDVDAGSTLETEGNITLGAGSILKVSGIVETDSLGVQNGLGVTVGNTTNGRATINVNDGGDLDYGSFLSIPNGTVTVFANATLDGHTDPIVTIGGSSVLRLNGSGAKFTADELTVGDGSSGTALFDVRNGGATIGRSIKLDGNISVGSSSIVLVNSNVVLRPPAPGGILVALDGVITGAGIIAADIALYGGLFANATAQRNSLTVSSIGSGYGFADIGDNTTLEIGGAVGSSDLRVSFEGNNAHLTLDAPRQFSAELDRFSLDDVLQLNSVQVASIEPVFIFRDGHGADAPFVNPLIRFHFTDGTAADYRFLGKYSGQPVFNATSSGSNSIIRLTSGNLQSDLKQLLDGYLSGATVFRDDNRNRAFDTGESSATSDATGNFSLATGTGPLVAMGGTDISTGLAFNGLLLAPAGANVVSPLTTLVEGLAETGNANPVSAVLSALNLPSGYTLLSTDPSLGTNNDDTDSKAVVVAGAQVQDTEALIAAALTATGLRTVAAASKSVDAFTTFLTTDPTVKLTSQADLTAIAATAGLGADVANAIGTVAAATNATLAATIGSTTLLDSVAAVQARVQGPAATDLAAAGSDATALSRFVDTYESGSDTACFCRGTGILTDRGDVAVEKLAVGDHVITLAGVAKLIVWIGMGRDLVTRANKLARPIIVRRGALADDVPKRDLYLTHGHALYLDGVLIPVENLVNHRSIVWDEAARIVEFFHIELEDHDVLLAEGAPAESYHDAGKLAAFQNTRPGFASGEAKPTYAPVLHGGGVVERVWARLFARADGPIEFDVTADPDLHLVLDGERIPPESSGDGVYRFIVPQPPVANLLLRSRVGVPSLLGLSRGDHRPLGVAITQLVVEQKGVRTYFDYDQPQLREAGCHRHEDGFCWTDGELQLPSRFLPRLALPFVVQVHTDLHLDMRYPLSPPIAQAA